MNGDSFFTTKYGIFDDGGKSTEKSPPDNLSQWVTNQFKGFTREGIYKINSSLKPYVYLVLTSLFYVRSSKASNSRSAGEA